jgi:hypothetical protein
MSEYQPVAFRAIDGPAGGAPGNLRMDGRAEAPATSRHGGG